MAATPVKAFRVICRGRRHFHINSNRDKSTEFHSLWRSVAQNDDTPYSELSCSTCRFPSGPFQDASVSLQLQSNPISVHGIDVKFRGVESPRAKSFCRISKVEDLFNCIMVPKDCEPSTFQINFHKELFYIPARILHYVESKFCSLSYSFGTNTLAAFHSFKFSLHRQPSSLLIAGVNRSG